MNSEAIDAYIDAQNEDVKPILNKTRETISAAIPGASEKISYGLPTWWNGLNLIHFSASKNHLGIYPGAKAVVVFQDRLTGFDQSKGTIRFPYNQPIPYELIADISRWCFDNYRR